MNDLISRKAILERLCEPCKLKGSKFAPTCNYPCCIYKEIANAPSVDVAPNKTGEWLQIQYGVLVCSECKKQSLHKNYYMNNLPTKFCPHCGAKMNM